MGNELTMRGITDEQQVELATALASPFDGELPPAEAPTSTPSQPAIEHSDSVDFVPMRRDVDADDEIGNGSPRSRRRLDRSRELQLSRDMDDAYHGSLRGGDL